MNQGPVSPIEEPPLRRDVLRFFIGFAVPPVIIIAAMAAVAGKTGIEKGLSRFLQPDALFWCVLTGVVALGFRRGRVGIALVVAWLVYTVGGSPLLIGQVNQWLEAPYLTVRPLERSEQLRYTVVLGGGTSIGGNQEPQLGGSGDRVMVAARLLLSGKTETLICTGAPIAGLSRPGLPTAGEQTERMLLDLGANPDSIVMIGGRNTSEEMIAIRELFEERLPADEPLGVVTSLAHAASHAIGRRAQGLNAQPLPADFRTSPSWITPTSFVPSSRRDVGLGSAVRELVAGFVGR
ncbi:MAG: YdcF family protein [Pirellulaceae bacterium]